jgi:hypothetical protein
MKSSAIAQAFQSAAQIEGQFVVKGRGHVERVALREHISRAAAPSLAQGHHWDLVAPGPRCGMRRMFARPIVERAAAILGCQVADLVTANYA